jgi:hypothetical protein
LTQHADLFLYLKYIDSCNSAVPIVVATIFVRAQVVCIRDCSFRRRSRITPTIASAKPWAVWGAPRSINHLAIIAIVAVLGFCHTQIDTLSILQCRGILCKCAQSRYFGAKDILALS